MADYWLAPSLEVFRAEANALYPNRDKTSDGWIGDKKHAASDSDHNPEGWRGNPKRWAGVVRAFDIDNDLAVGKNAQSLADYLASQLGKHPALGSGAYLIYNGRIISTDRLSEGWRKYSGKNPHKGHVHISVGRSPSAYNSKAPWGLNPAKPVRKLTHGGPMTIYLFSVNGQTKAILAHNGGFVEIVYVPESGFVKKGETKPKTEYQNFIEAGVKAIWMNQTTVNELIEDARGLANRG